MKDTVPNIIEKKNTRSRWRITGLTILLVILILVFLVIVTANSANPYNSDFLKFYLSARFWLGEQSIYTPATLDTLPEDIQIDPDLFANPILPNLNPPFQSLLISPFGLLNYPNAYWTWSLVSLALGLLAVYLIFNAYQEELHSLHVFELSIIFLLFFPTILSILSGQISIILLFLITIAWVSARKRKDRLAGIALGIALSFKIFSGLFIPVLIIQRRWNLLKWYLGTFITCNLVAIFLVGWDDHIEYLKTISSITWYSASWNTSFMGFFTRIFGDSESIPIIDSPITGLILTLVLSTLAVLLLLWLAKNTGIDNKYDFDLVFSLTIISILLISPLGWIYYYVVLIIPLIVAWSAAKQLDNKLLKELVVGAWILCSIPYALLIQGEEIRPIDIFIWSGFPLYGLLLFMIILVILFWNSRNKIYNFPGNDLG